MNPETLEEATGFDDAVRMAHVELHGDKGKAYLFPTEVVEVKTQEGRTKKKSNVLDATASEFHQEMHHVMASYVVPNDTKGLVTAKEITTIDLSFPPLVTKGEDLEKCIEKKPYAFPKEALLSFKPQKARAPKSQRSRDRAKKRQSKGTQVHFDKIDSNDEFMKNLPEMTSSPTFKTFFSDVAQKAKQEGMPLWDYILAMPEVNAGRQRSRSVPVYHPNSRRELNREEVTADLRQTAVRHTAEVAVKRSQLYYPSSEEIMAHPSE